MNVRAVPRTAVESYLRLVRLPLDGAISLLPGNGVGAKPAARLSLDRADASLRAVIARILGDPLIRGAAQPRGTSEREHALRPGDDAGTADTDVSERRSASRGTAQVAEEMLLGGRAPAERVKTVSANPDTPRRKPGELTGRGSSDGSETWRARLQAAPSARSHQDIADRAYELYRRGVPGDADAHWLAAEREVTLVPE